MKLHRISTAIRSLSLALLLTIPATAADWIDLSDKPQDFWTKVGGGATYQWTDGMIVGRTGPGANTFLTAGPYSDFELEYEVKCDPPLNSGVQIHSHLYEEETPQESDPKRKREAGEMYGYQCEIRADLAAPVGSAGNFWDEGRRTKWLDEDVDGEKAQAAYKPGEWNHFRIVAKGNRIQSFVNGQPIADFTDDRDAEGLIGLQVHSISPKEGPYSVAWKNIRLRELEAAD